MELQIKELYAFEAKYYFGGQANLDSSLLSDAVALPYSTTNFLILGEATKVCCTEGHVITGAVSSGMAGGTTELEGMYKNIFVQ